MALLFMDGFDHYEITEILQKWDSITESGHQSIETSVVRRVGGRALKMETTAGHATLSLTKGFPQTDTIYVGFAFRTTLPYYLDNVGLRRFLYLTSGSGQECGLTVNIDGSISLCDGYSTPVVIASTAGGVIKINTWHYVEVKFIIHGTTGGALINVDGNEVLNSFSHDTKQVSSTVGGIVLNNASQLSGTKIGYFDDLYIDSAQFHGDVYITPINAASDGTHHEWDPLSSTNVSQISEALVDNDTSYNYASVANKRDTYNFTDLTGGGNIHAVAVNVTARKIEAGVVTIQTTVYASTTDFDSGADKYLTTSYLDHQEIWEENPDTEAPWDDANVNSSEFGVVLKAI